MSKTSFSQVCSYLAIAISSSVLTKLPLPLLMTLCIFRQEVEAVTTDRIRQRFRDARNGEASIHVEQGGPVIPMLIHSTIHMEWLVLTACKRQEKRYYLLF